MCRYRPPVPILTLVVPHLVSDGLSWKLEGRCAMDRGNSDVPVWGGGQRCCDVMAHLLLPVFWM